VNGAARPFEHCSKQSSDSPMPPQRNAFRHRDVRQQSRSFARKNPRLRHSPNNLFAADASDQTIFKFTPSGAQSVFVGPAAFTGVQFPVGLAFDRSGNLWVTTEGNEGGPGGDAILVFAPDRTESTFATDLADPRGIAFDPSGDLLVAELKAAAPGDILKFSNERQPNGLRFWYRAAPG